jgi:hypothetical protein
MGESDSPDLFILERAWMPKLVVGNDRFPWPVQDKPSSLFLLLEYSMTL